MLNILPNKKKNQNFAKDVSNSAIGRIFAKSGHTGLEKPDFEIKLFKAFHRWRQAAKILATAPVKYS